LGQMGSVHVQHATHRHGAVAAANIDLAAIVHGGAAASLPGDSHAKEEREERGSADGGKRVRPPEGHQGAHGSVGRCQVGQLVGTAAVAAGGVLAGVEKGDERGAGRASGQRMAEDGQGVEDPIADPGAAGVERYEP
jgi:hypothetical protein